MNFVDKIVNHADDTVPVRSFSARWESEWNEKETKAKASGTDGNNEKAYRRCRWKETARNINDLIVHNQKDSENTE